MKKVLVVIFWLCFECVILFKFVWVNKDVDVEFEVLNQNDLVSDYFIMLNQFLDVMEKFVKEVMFMFV